MVDFYREWRAYKCGFGYLNGEFWLGLDKIHRLTESGHNKLRVDLELPGETAFAEYSFFAVENETEKYKLSVGCYSGEVIILVSASREKCAILFPMFSAITVFILSAVNVKLCKLFKISSKSVFS